MIDETFIIPVAVDPEQAVAFAANFDNLMQWDPAVRGVQRLTEAALEVGTRWRVTTLMGPVPLDIDYEVLELDPCRAVLQGRRGRTLITDVISATPTNEGAALSYRVQVENGRIASLFDPLSRRLLLPAFKKAAARLPAAMR